MDTTKEQRLVHQALEGDGEAYSAIIRWVGPPLVRYLTVMLQDGPTAEDVAQEVFARAFRRLSDLKDPKKFRGWLWRIAHCAALDFIRFKNRRKPVFECLTSDGETESLLGTAPSAESCHMFNDLLEQVRREVDGLPESMRELVVMRYSEQCSYAEISKRLDLTISQVKARLARARVRLREPLTELAHEWMRLRDEMS